MFFLISIVLNLLLITYLLLQQDYWLCLLLWFIFIICRGTALKAKGFLIAYVDLKDMRSNLVWILYIMCLFQFIFLSKACNCHHLLAKWHKLILLRCLDWHAIETLLGHIRMRNHTRLSHRSHWCIRNVILIFTYIVKRISCFFVSWLWLFSV